FLNRNFGVFKHRFNLVRNPLFIPVGVVSLIEEIMCSDRPSVLQKSLNLNFEKDANKVCGWRRRSVRHPHIEAKIVEGKSVRRFVGTITLSWAPLIDCEVFPDQRLGLVYLRRV